MERKVFKKLLHKCTKSHFLFNGKVYKQIDGVQMGSPLGPTFANWFLGEIENNIFAISKPFYPKFYVRYVDDVCAVFRNSGDVNKFLQLLNDQHEQLQFTVEKTQGTLPFLDVEIRFGKNEIETGVYRKKTDTGTILNFKSLAPMAWKIGLWKCLWYRATQICSSQFALRKELNHLKALFLNNGYPYWWVRKAEANTATIAKKKKEDLDGNEDYVLLRLPYIGIDSTKLSRRLTKLFEKDLGVQLRTVYNSFKVGQYFGLKDQVPWQLAPNVVYEFKCSVDRDITYIGMSTRQLVARVAEHFDPKKQSAVQTHVAECNECANSSNCLDRFEVIQFCRNKWETEIAEAMLITERRPMLNKQLGASNGCSFTIKVFK